MASQWCNPKWPHGRTETITSKQLVTVVTPCFINPHDLNNWIDEYILHMLYSVCIIKAGMVGTSRVTLTLGQECFLAHQKPYSFLFLNVFSREIRVLLFQGHYGNWKGRMVSTEHDKPFREPVWLIHCNCLAHCGPVTQHCGGSMLCKIPIFSLWKNSPKFKMLWFF